MCFPSYSRCVRSSLAALVLAGAFASGAQADIILDGDTLRGVGNHFYSTENIIVGPGGGTFDVTRIASNFGTMRLAGQISGAGPLTLTGFGELRLDGDSSAFTGAFVVNNGILRLKASNDRGSVTNLPMLGASSLTVRSGGELLLDYGSLGTTPSYSIVNESVPVHMEGGRIQFLSNNATGTGVWQQNLGDLHMDRGYSRIYLNRTNSSSAAVLSFGDLHRSVGTTVSFDWGTSAGTLGLAGNNPRILFASLPEPLNDGIMGGWALVNQNNFATYHPVNGVAIATYTSSDITTAGAADNVEMSQGNTVIAIGDTTINSLKWAATASTATLEQADGSTLTLDAGGLLALGNFSKLIRPESGGTAFLTANGGGLYVHNAQGTITINSNIIDGDMPTALVKTQAGSLTLNGVNTYSGGTYIIGAANVTTGSTANQTYLGSGPVHVTRGILTLNRQGATTSEEGYSVFEGGSIYLGTSSVAYNTPGDRFTIDGTSTIGGVSASGMGLNSLTYVSGPVTAGGQASIAPGAVILHGSNSSAMGTGVNTVQGLPLDMQFYFGDAATQTSGSRVTIGVGTPWKGLGTDRNTRAWDLGTITVNGSEFELNGLLVANQTGEGQSAYTLQLGNNSAGVTNGLGPIIIGAEPGPLTAYVTGAIVRLEDDLSVFGDTTNGSLLTFAVTAGATLDMSQSNAMGSGTGIAAIDVLAGGTLQQFFSTTVSTANTARTSASSSAINGDVTVRAGGRLLAQNTNGFDGTGTLTFEAGSVIQIATATGWVGPQLLPANGLISGQNQAIVRIGADNFGTAAEPTLTTYFDGTGVYEWVANANAANPSAPNTVILSLDGGLVMNDSFDRNLDSTANGFIELKPGGAGGTFAASTGQFFAVFEDVELHGQTLTIGYADVIGGNPRLGDLRMSKVTSDTPGGMIRVIGGAQLRINATNAIDDTISILLDAGGRLDVDNNDTILKITGAGATSRILGDATLTVTAAGDYSLGASLGETASLTHAGGGVLTLDQDSDGVGTLSVTNNGTLRIANGVSLGQSYTLNAAAGSTIDINGSTVSGTALAGAGVIELNGGSFAFTAATTVNTRVNGPGSVQNIGTGSVAFNDPSLLTNITSLDILNGEMRFNGTSNVAGSHLINVPTINLGDGLVTTGGTGMRVFPRIFLVNTETTQTATLNVYGGWIASDLGEMTPIGVGQDIWSGSINFTGASTINIFDVNDVSTNNRTQPEEHYVSGVIGGTGGFTKINTGSLILTAANTISGDIAVQRAGPGGTGVASQGSLVLAGPNGALAQLNSLLISRDGGVHLDNSENVNNNRLGNNTAVTLRENGRLRLLGNGTAPVSETVGALVQETGSGRVQFDLSDTSPQSTTLTFASYTRQAGSITHFNTLEATPGALGSFSGGLARVFITDVAGTVQYGGGTGNSSTTKSIVLGAFGGVNNISDHFMTFDSANPGELRPLDFATEYLLSSNLPTAGLLDSSFTALFGVNQNFMLNYDVNRDGDVNWYGARPNFITTNVGVNSLRMGSKAPTSTTNTTNTNDLASVLLLNEGVRLYLGDSLAANNGLGVDTNGSGMILFGRAEDGTTPGRTQIIAGGTLDFGSREALIVNSSGNNAIIRSEISGSGGLTKAGSNTLYLDGTSSYTGTTTIAEGILILRNQHALGNTDMVRIDNSGQLYLELGITPATLNGGNAPDMFIGTTDATRVVLYSNSANNTWGGNIIVDSLDNLGAWVYTARLSVNTLASLNINGNIYSNELLNPINTDATLSDPRLVSTIGGSGSGGVINLNGQFRDNALGSIGAPVTTDNENQVLRFQIGGSNDLVVNVRQQWDSAGAILLEQGILRYEGEGNFWTDGAAASITASNGHSGLRMSGTAGGTNNGTANNAFILTKAGQALNVGRIDIGGSGTNNNNGYGNVMLAGTNTSGTVTFGNGTERVVYGSVSATNSHVRDLSLYAAGGGTVNLNFRLDDTDTDVHTAFTKIGRGVVNYNGAGATDGDVEQVNVSGGLLRLTNYGVATGRRFSAGAMMVLAGGGIEMDGVGSLTNITADYTGAAVLNHAAFPDAATVIAAGGTDVIVTSDVGRTTTMNLGSTTTTLTRRSGGTVNFVVNGNGGDSVITLRGVGAPADGAAIAWATYGDTYAYNAALASYSVNALDFAMTSGGVIGAFAGANREDTDNAATWTDGRDISEGLAGFFGTTAAGASINTLHFDFDGSSTLTLDAGGLTVISGGIMVNSLVSSAASVKTISGGSLRAGPGQDLILHQYGSGALQIESSISDNGGTALVKTGPGMVVLVVGNSYTGGTFINGGTLSVSGDASLGAVPETVVADNIYINGGTLQATVDMTLSDSRGITLGGNGATLDVSSGTTLTYGGVIASEPGLFANYVVNSAVGNLDKTGSGTLVLTGVDNTFSGLLDIREGTLVWEGATTASGTRNPFGTHTEFLDGTIVRSGATLALHPTSATSGSALTQTLQEWFVFEGGSTLDLAPVNTAALPHNNNLNFRGVIKFDSLGHAGTLDGTQTAGTLAGATIINTVRNTVNLNDAGGYITGDGGITKVGAGLLAFRESNPEWTGQLIISEGAVDVYSAGTPLGVGTMPIILGHSLAAEQAGEFVTGNTAVQLLVRNESGFRSTFDVSQNIIVRSDAGAGEQLKRIGARYMAYGDVVNYNGTLTLQDDVELYYRDDTRNSASTGDVTNNTRATDAPTNSETVFINFNGSITGSGNLATHVEQLGNGNVVNGSITAPFDDMVINAVFGLNGDNRGWTGDLLISNNNSIQTDDVDRIAIIRLGNEHALNDNTVRFASRGYLQLAGIDKTFTQNFLFVGGSGLVNTAKIQNASASDMTITFSADATKTGVSFQDIGVGMEDGVMFGGSVDNRGALGVIKTGVGETVFGASTGGGGVADSFSSYTGTTQILQGTLYAGSNNAFSPYSRFIVSDGAVLSLYWDNAQTGFENTIGSLSGTAGSSANINYSILSLGGDNTRDANFAGTISGSGTLYMTGHGAQQLSGNNTFRGDLAVLQGTLIGGSNTAFGDEFNLIYLGGVPLATTPPIDSRVELLLAGTATSVDNQVVMNYSTGNVEGITLIGTRENSGNYGFSEYGEIDASQDFFAVSDGTSTFSFGGKINSFESATLTKIGLGTVELRTTNHYGPAGISSGTAINGGTVIRHGTLALFDDGALSSTVVELGDVRRDLTDVYLATNGSLLGTAAASYDLDGTGSFLKIRNIIDGVTLTSSDIGKRILVKDERDNPEWNGIYEIVSVDMATGQMTLSRTQDFDEVGEMLYGSNVGVTHGTQAGQEYFMASRDVQAVNGENTEPVYWERDYATSNVALLLAASGLTISRNIDINDTNGGTTTIGGSFDSGTSTITGNITLQHLDLPGVDNVRELIFTSASDDEAGPGERGLIFSGVLSEATVGDILHVTKKGAGTVTFTNASTYTGKTTVSEGTLVLAGQGAVTATTWLEVASGATFDFASSDAGDFTFDGPVSGSGRVVTGAGSLIIGTNGGAGSLRPGMSSEFFNAATAGNGIGTLTVDGSLVLTGSSTRVERLTLQMGATNGADYNDGANFSAQIGAGTFASWLTSQAAFYDTKTGGNHDRLVVTGSFSMDAGGTISFSGNGGSTYHPVFGDVFNLIDWASADPNGFNRGGNWRTGGLLGDLELPDLGLTGLLYDTSLFFSHGIIVVVPEPGRAVLVLLGLSALLLRRRRHTLPQV